jgi:hypothetical protein
LVMEQHDNYVPNKRNNPLFRGCKKQWNRKLQQAEIKYSVLKTAIKHHTHITENMSNGQYLVIMVHWKFCTLSVNRWSSLPNLHQDYQTSIKSTKPPSSLPNLHQVYQTSNHSTPNAEFNFFSKCMH